MLLKDKTAEAVPPKDIMVPFWRAVMIGTSDQSPRISSASESLDTLWRPILPDEVTKALPGTATAPGPDGLTARQLKAVPAGLLARIFNLFMISGKLPSYLMEARTTLIPKKDGANDSGDFRQITVSSVLVRCLENVFDLDLVIKYCRQMFKHLYVASIDIAKAFDSISHNNLRDIMIIKSLPTPLLTT